jgi:hypothetical protein
MIVLVKPPAARRRRLGDGYKCGARCFSQKVA